MKALTLWRPWDDLVLSGAKPIENRTWAPGRRLEVGSWFAIHAGKVVDRAACDMAADLGFPPPALSTEMAIVGAVQFLGVCKASSNPWFFGPVGWVLANPVRCEPFRSRGAQGLWEVPFEADHRLRCAIVDAGHSVGGT